MQWTMANHRSLLAQYNGLHLGNTTSLAGNIVLLLLVQSQWTLASFVSCQRHGTCLVGPRPRKTFFSESALAMVAHHGLFGNLCGKPSFSAADILPRRCNDRNSLQHQKEKTGLFYLTGTSTMGYNSRRCEEKRRITR